MTATFYIETFGCQMNERDSETIAALLAQKGMEETQDPKKADVILLNTCAVRETAEAKVWSRLGRIHSLRKADEVQPVLVLAGCMAQIPENIERIRQRLPFVQVVAGPGNLHRIPELIAEAGKMAGTDAKARAGETRAHPMLRTAVTAPRTGGVRDESTQVLPEGLPRANIQGVSAYVTIMYGCDNFCSYCVVPYVRGPQVSRPKDAIRDEVAYLVDRGYKEITLLGQNVNAYGHDLGDDGGFAALLRDINRVDGLSRIRYFTSHPRDFTKDMVDAVRDCEKVCEHFHLPLQSGSDAVLKTMNRGYTAERYMDLLDYIRDTVPENGVTTDIIAGFPGETEGDFEATLALVRRAKFDGAFTFAFSPRKGTAAARMKGQISKAEKSERMQRLVNTQAEITREINRAMVGREVEILIESVEPSGNGEPASVKGRTRNGKTVQGMMQRAIAGLSKSPGDLATVRIDEAGTWYLKGPVTE